MCESIRWYKNRNRTAKCLKRLQKRSINDNLRQLVIIRQDRVLLNKSTCFFTSDSEFFFYFSKKTVGWSDDGKRNILWGWPYWGSRTRGLLGFRANYARIIKPH